jgi:hypothetical protein
MSHPWLEAEFIQCDENYETYLRLVSLGLQGRVWTEAFSGACQKEACLIHAGTR